ncbi:NAD-dependent malic enzyme, partial [Lactococcus lactis]|nr:NAD-dependent malic enzyme [Lactococcus lactis]
MLTGLNLLNNPFLNKGTAFTKEERAKYGITGMLPSTVQTLEQQSVQAYGQYLSKQTDLEKRIFLMNLFNTNRTLFYKLMGEHLVEFMPVVYDPVVA